MHFNFVFKSMTYSEQCV